MCISKGKQVQRQMSSTDLQKRPEPENYRGPGGGHPPPYRGDMPMPRSRGVSRQNSRGLMDVRQERQDRRERSSQGRLRSQSANPYGYYGKENLDRI